MGNTSSRSISLSGSQSLGASGQLSASTQSGRASQNFAAVTGIFLRAYENGHINLPEMKVALERLAIALDNDPELNSAVDLSFINELQDWKKGNEHMFPHVQLAVYCSKEVYHLRTMQAIIDRKEQASDSQAKLVEAGPAELLLGKEASYLQNTKNWALFKDAKSNNLYFSVRGTSTTGIATVIDNLTNLDAEAKLTTNFSPENQGMFKAHRGFLEVAEAMFLVTKAVILKEAKGLNPQPTLVFCGHSAGGGTAFFLYHYFQIHTSLTERNAFKDIHCITFGSAAIASIPNPVHSTRTEDRILSFINANDPVPRAELPYADWLAETLGKYLAIQGGSQNIPPYSALPKQILYPGGELVLLDEGGEVVGKLESDVLGAKAFHDLTAHDCAEYQRIVSSLL
ncbi:Alpha/Beta hydrolase protein [Mycena metata]|uniref:Alpha/Beta hydrolase protein n=1 Tax=Mycena metata TaxID=1033252 RepID=A0AAD7K471_9AGAR|nr:Alpha/Beta hydrolase protein [Mycena metata]